MSIEIGSEYNKVPLNNGKGLGTPIPGEYVFSGRTAIETVLKEIPEAETAILPSYCCFSMIQPFLDRAIKVEFYPVNYKNGLHIELNGYREVDIILLSNFFGFKNNMPDLSGFKKHGGIIIEDITHSLLSEEVYHGQSDYLVASIRKWEPLYCGGYCAAMKGSLHQIPTKSPSEEFLSQKKNAMELKTMYLAMQDESMKSHFLSLFDDCNHWLSQNYCGLAIDEWSKKFILSADVDAQKKIRRKNAHVLYEKLNGKVSFLFPEKDMDCPLFVPIILNNRDDVRRKLIEEQIYCPIHWPKTEGCNSNIYDMELSLICDQRYGEADMDRIAEALKAAL